MEEYLSAAEVASYLDVGYRTIENWKAQGKIESKDGKYGLKSAIAYRIEQLNDELEAIKDDGSLELKKQKLIAEVDERKAIAKIKNLEAEQKEGTLVIAEEVLNAWANLIQACKAKLIAVPSKLALELSGMDDPEAIQERLQEEIDTALTELSN